MEIYSPSLFVPNYRVKQNLVPGGLGPQTKLCDFNANRVGLWFSFLGSGFQIAPGPGNPNGSGIDILGNNNLIYLDFAKFGLLVCMDWYIPGGNMSNQYVIELIYYPTGAQE